MSHDNVHGSVTDSAASATAMATGVLVENRVISQAIPGSGADLATVVDVFVAEGKAIGLVTTSQATDATPAAFGAHAPDRGDDADIAADYLERSRPLVLMGAPSEHLTIEAAEAAGYAVVQTGDEMVAAPVKGSLAGLFSPLLPPGYPGHDPTIPTLPEMAAVALDRLDRDPDGFFLLIEHEGTDTFAHRNDLAGVLGSMRELEVTLDVIERWVADHPDTLVIFTADHETGGIEVVTPALDDALPVVSWATTGHTATPVPVFAIGRGSDDAVAIIATNADIHDALLIGR